MIKSMLRYYDTRCTQTIESTLAAEEFNGFASRSRHSTVRSPCPLLMPRGVTNGRAATKIVNRPTAAWVRSEATWLFIGDRRHSYSRYQLDILLNWDIRLRRPTLPWLRSDSILGILDIQDQSTSGDKSNEPKLNGVMSLTYASPLDSHEDDSGPSAVDGGPRPKGRDDGLVNQAVIVWQAVPR
ncbi:hypothetical protein EVAR_96752_1 [Eumeta japonica]|uniref:Uncharacterized protein n=1 Tax=Eumeta variegata TaxID=151549 RepID=A0A4C1Y038_EUMVA|nr:hypothetical protein EVAR_96752_1 [Eumeta japonica]